ncbi:hypothetical protein AB0I41_18885, partial [Micromonospora sp. NPDC050200]
GRAGTRGPTRFSVRGGPGGPQPVATGTTTRPSRRPTRPVGEKPFVEVKPTDHPLTVTRRTGMTTAQVQQIAERLLHPGAR